MVGVRCHCCGTRIVGCSGSLSWPDGRPFEGPPEFHCPRCTERRLAAGGPCHAHRGDTDG